jgi:glycosyltransferase involved in cell wall biosynthesis
LRRRRPLLLAVGQLKHKKGLHHLLDACRILVDRGSSFDCEIVGDGPLRGELTARIAELGLRSHVRLLGALPHEVVVERYREASIFVLPCVTGPDGGRDGIPNVILEAMAMGVPVVSTRHSGIPEAVQDGRTGLLVPPGDAEQLAGAIARLLDDGALRERLGSRGRERVREVFDIEANAKALLAEVLA